MKPKRPSKTKALKRVAPSFNGLLRDVRALIAEGRQQVLRAVDVVQVRTCWGVGRHIVEFEQRGAARALPRLAEILTKDFGKGFDERNLRHMRAFYLAFPIRNALRSELSWTHYRTLLRVEDAGWRPRLGFSRVVPLRCGHGKTVDRARGGGGRGGHAQIRVCTGWGAAGGVFGADGRADCGV